MSHLGENHSRLLLCRSTYWPFWYRALKLCWWSVPGTDNRRTSREADSSCRGERGPRWQGWGTKRCSSSGLIHSALSQGCRCYLRGSSGDSGSDLCSFEGGAPVEDSCRSALCLQLLHYGIFRHSHGIGHVFLLKLLRGEWRKGAG